MKSPKSLYHANKNRLDWLLYGLCLCIFLFSLFAIFPAAADDSVPQSGDLELFKVNESGPSKLLGLHLESRASIDISGLIATIEVEQAFENPSTHWVEGRYVFPLPENAAINSMEIQVGERIIKANIKEKKEAKKIYNQAKREGKKAGLMEQHRPNLFSQNIANIAPNEKVTVRFRYIQHVEYQDNIFSLRFPMTLTPRYIPGIKQKKIEANEDIHIQSQHGWASATDQVPDAALITPPMIENYSSETTLLNPIQLDITLEAGLPLASIDSAYHAISVAKTGTQHNISLAKGKVSMDRDFTLSWQTTNANTPRAAIFNESIDGDDYSLIMLMPPKTQGVPSPSINKETLFIIDTSGSMGGTSIKQAKAGLAYALQQLHPQDTFNIIEFNSDFSTLYNKPQVANRDNINRALSFVRKLNAGGGTEMLPALNAAFQQTTNHKALKQIIFITDGSIGNESALFNNLHNQLGNARLFTIGIGSAPNSFFMRKAAEFGRGSFTYIGDINEVNEKMRALFSKINNPSMRDITIEDAQGRPLEIFPHPIPDLYSGQPVFAAIKKNYESDQLVIKGRYLNQGWEKTLHFNHGKNNQGVAKLWARKKIEHLLDKERTEGKQQAIKDRVIKIALQHQLISPYTSFVAVEEAISRPSDKTLETKAIPNLVAKGQQLQPVNYPQTATPLWLHIIFGFVSILAAGILRLGSNSRKIVF